MHSKALYFSGVTEDALPELQKLFKASRGIRLNVDPHSSEKITGNVEFRNVYDTEKAMVVLNNKVLQNNTGTLKMTPLQNNIDLGPPPSGGYISIKHIPEAATESTLYDFLRPSGPIYSCSFPTHPNGQRKGIAHACFTDQQYAQIALEQLNFAEYLGNNVHIQISRPPRRQSKPTAGGSRKNSVKAPSVSGSEPQSGAQTPPLSSSSSQQPMATAASAAAAPAAAAMVPVPVPVPIPTSVPVPVPVSVPVSAPARSLSRQSSVTHSQGRGAISPSSSEPSSGGPGSGLGGVIVPGKLFVTNLHPTVSHKELFALFKKYGYIQSARVSIDPTTKKSRGHGIVQFSDPNAALDALSECQGADIKGRKITMYQYEHVNKQHHSQTQSQSQSQVQTPMQMQMQQHSQQEMPANGNGSSNTNAPTESDLAAAFEQSVAVSKEHAQGQEQNTVPFPRPNSVASTSTPTTAAADALIDPTVLRNISESSRNEILTQKLISEIAANPAVDVCDASRIVDSFLKRPLEDILALLSDPRLLASEWDLEQKASAHMASYASPVLDSPVSQKLSPAAAFPRSSDGIHLHDYDTETEEFIEMLLSKTESERKTKLGSKLFPLIKGMGYRDSTKITVWILGHMSHDVRSLAYTLNDSAKLYALVEEAQGAINGADKK
ncbi:hypothetical protein LPJ75_002367 [Coemansia sp. RSA 2598]|nr:hypothetical protein LPJ75_002367 [Coemansia sp. RSA 2598]